MAELKHPIEPWEDMEVSEVVFPDGGNYEVHHQSDLGGYCKKITSYFEVSAMARVIWFDVTLVNADDVRIPGHALMRIHYRKVN